MESPDSNLENQTTLNVSSQGPYELREVIEDIKTHDYYNGYDNDTVNWMESLGSKKVFTAYDKIVIMDSGDASKLPSEFATDVSINDIFECNVIESHSLGDLKYHKDVLLVNNVKFLKQELHYYEV